jgi:putative tryptophan/tyrosine transport system substrate-binding protein
MTTRRDFIAGLAGTAAVPPSAYAQTATRTLRIGTVNVQPRSAPNWLAFVKRLTDLGYIEGQNVVYDHVQLPDVEDWERLYREMVARQPDVVIAAGPERSLKAARAAAGSLPIVMIAVDYDPIAKGHVANLARPGGNVTGVYYQSIELVAKNLQLLKELAPDVTAATVFWDQASADFWAALQVQGPKFGLAVNGVAFRQRPYEYEQAMANVAPAYARSLITIGSPFFFLDRERLAAFALQRRMAWLTQSRESVVAGALMSYSANLSGMFALAATYVDRIAKGTTPADLPVQQPTRFELALNLKTAEVLGITVPPLFLAQADEVIE